MQAGCRLSNLFNAGCVKFCRKDVLLGLVSTRPNQAERDLRMVRVKSKVIGTFRSEQGARDFLMLKSFTSTAAKAGVTAFDALLSLFVGQMMWGSE